MSRKQFVPHQGSHEKKLTRKERKEQKLENSISTGNNEPVMVTAPDENDKKQLRNLTIISVIGLALLMVLMYMLFVSQ